jgi:hypothetical protein
MLGTQNNTTHRTILQRQPHRDHPYACRGLWWFISPATLIWLLKDVMWRSSHGHYRPAARDKQVKVPNTPLHHSVCSFAVATDRHRSTSISKVYTINYLYLRHYYFEMASVIEASSASHIRTAIYCVFCLPFA